MSKKALLQNDPGGVSWLSSRPPSINCSNSTRPWACQQVSPPPCPCTFPPPCSCLSSPGPVNRYPHPSNFKHLLVLVHFLPPCSCPCSQLLCPGSPLHMAPLRLPKSSSRLAVLVKIKAGTGTALRLISINFSSLDICPGNSHSYRLQKFRFLSVKSIHNFGTFTDSDPFLFKELFLHCWRVGLVEQGATGLLLDQVKQFSKKCSRGHC